jgi:mono/diheme cytochrome c family protein
LRFWQQWHRADAADLGAAEAQFKKSCGTCHVAEDGAEPRQGPPRAGRSWSESGYWIRL